MRRLLDEQGMVLTELLTAIAILGVVLGISLSLFAAFSNQQRRVDRQSLAQNNARRAIDRLAVQLRSATSGDTTGSQPIKKATSYDLVFLAPIQSPSLTNNARGVTHMRYCLDAGSLTNETLWFQTAPYNTTSNSVPPSTSSCPSPDWPSRQPVADYVVNQFRSPAAPVFTTSTDAAGNINDITIRALVDANTAADPAATDLQSSVTLRNLNRTPTASLSCQALSNGHALCDASASSDPDGDSLTYSWTMDGNPLAATSYQLDKSRLASKSTHSFGVTVTDPSGLKSSATQTVTMP